MATSTTPGSYSIVSTMREQPEIIAAFVAHHLTLDVQELMIFLDGPDPEVEAMLAGLPRCRVTICNDQYWQDVQACERPQNVVQRQKKNYNLARKWASSDWLVHIDSDEFLMTTGSLSAELAAIGPETDLVRIRNLERFMPEGAVSSHIYQGLFRDQIIDRKLGRAIYGDSARLLNNGLTGYKRGKTATRVSSTQNFGLHAPKTEDDENDTAHSSVSTQLLHFDGFTPLHWVSKLLKRFARGQTKGSKARQQQMNFLSEASTGAERVSLYQKLMVLTPDVQNELRKQGALREFSFDPLPAMTTTFPGRSFDLTPASFDRRMINANSHWFTTMDLMPPDWPATLPAA